MPFLDNYSLDAYRLGGIELGPKYAHGTFVTGSEQASFPANESTGSVKGYPIIVSGLGFRPNRIIIRRSSRGSYESDVYDFRTLETAPSSSPSSGQYNIYRYNITTITISVYVYELTGANTSENAYVNESGFRFPLQRKDTEYVWEAFRI